MSKAKAINVTSATQSSVQVILDSVSKLAEVRKLYVTAEVKTGQVQQMYAFQMNDTFGVCWWDAKGEIKKAVKAEHTAFVEAFTHEGKTRANIDQMWKRIKIAAGRSSAPASKATGGSTDIDTKTISELKTIYNRFTNASEDEAPLSYKVKVQIEDILDQLGVEI
jgi:hypothetical protein